MKAKTTFWDFIDLENYKDNVKGLNYELVSIRYVIDLGQCVECICVVYYIFLHSARLYHD